MKTHRRQWLRTCTEVELFPTAPFSFRGTFHKPSHYPTADIIHDGRSVWQTLRLQNTNYGLKLTDIGSTKRPRINLSIYHAGRTLADSAVNNIKDELEYRYDLLSDLTDYHARLSNDRILRPIFTRWA